MIIKNDFKILAAPLQGYTESAWRIAHDTIFGGVNAYYTPFVRIEKGGFRNKDKRDITPVEGNDIHVVPQIIASETDEFRFLVDYIVSLGYTEIDLNMGCPFPLIVNRGKGSGILPYADKIASLLKIMEEEFSDIDFSVKMRLGMDSADDWRTILPMLNDSCISRITLHPRLGSQQYKGVVDIDSFAEFYTICSKPLIYNGDLTNIEDINNICNMFPDIEGVMLGRGLLAHGCLATDFRSQTPMSRHELYHKTLEMHSLMYRHYSSVIEGGDAQLLQKLKTMWEYWLPDMDKKKRKAILKASRLELYTRAVYDALAECSLV